MPLASPPHNIPSQLTSFIGREREIADIARSLRDARLLTLAGPGGAGKTRLAVEVARQALNDFADGVWMVELAALNDPALVITTLAATLGLREEMGQTRETALLEWLKARNALIILDNCEHLVEACASLAHKLLPACPDLHIMATSRRVLNVTWEIAWRVPSMSFPETGKLMPFERLAEYEAIRLFAERAKFKRPGFTLTPENAPSVVTLCQGLDGMPLALELAAARMSVLPVEQIAARLDERFRLLVLGSREAPTRQQTLRGAIDWSYDLLSPEGQELLNALSVFAGSFSLEAIADVYRPGGDEYETLDTLSELVDQSLVLAEERTGEARYRLLDTIRQYAWEKVRASGQAHMVHNRHFEWYLRLAEEAKPELHGPGQKVWLDRLDTEHDNLRAALQWTLSSAESNVDIPHSALHTPRSIEGGLQMVLALWWFWYVRGYLSEGRRWSERVLAVAGEQDPSLLASVLYGAGTLASSQGEYDQAEDLFNRSLLLYRQMEEKTGVASVLDAVGVLRARQSNYRDAALSFMESLTIRRELGDKRGIDSSLNNLGHVATVQGDYIWARQLLEESLAISRERGDTLGIGITLNNLGHVALNLGDYEAAGELYTESLQIKRGLGDKVGMASSLNSLGNVARHEGKREEAVALYQESLDLARELGHKEMLVVALNSLGHFYFGVGDYIQARAHYKESLTVLRDSGDKQALATTLLGLAQAAGVEGQLYQSATLFGTADALLKATGAHLEPQEQEKYSSSMDVVRARLKDEKWQEAWQKGEALTPAEAVNMALVLPDLPASAHTEEGEVAKIPPPELPFELSRRELEVLMLLMEGLSDAQIAERLFLSRHTVHAHLRSVFSKLGVTNRLAAARVASDFGLR